MSYLFTHCTRCAPRAGGGTPSLASARWTFAYKSGKRKSASLCAACGFAMLTKPSVIATTPADPTLEPDETRTGEPLALVQLKQQLQQALRRLEGFQRA